MRVIGTAGHVDHGKSTLIEALTGTHPDRLKEERAREMTIDLGFASLILPGGEQVGIVDVPGHRDFIENMLAGVGGIDAALFVVAADEGIMPQTREHLAILDILQVRGGVIALTKADLVDDPQWLELVEGDIRQVMAGTVLESAPIVRVSARTRAGLQDLVSALQEVLSSNLPRPDLGLPRLPVDRVFTMPGFGTVVTGTLIDGSFRIGDEVVVQPAGWRGRVRGLQSHNRKEEVARPGSRTAMNIAGLDVDEVRRGSIICRPGQHTPTRRLDASFTLLRDSDVIIRHNMEVKLFLFTQEVLARLRLLGSEELEPGQAGWLQLELASPVVAVRGDRYILRRPSPGETLGGGEILNPHPSQRHRRFSENVLEELEAYRQGTPAEILLQALQGSGAAPAAELVRQTGLALEASSIGLHELVQGGLAVALEIGEVSPQADLLLAAPAWLVDFTRQAEGVLAAFHAANPLRPGIPREELKSRLRLENRLFAALVARMAQQGVIAEEGSTVRLATHIIRLSPGQEAVLAAVMQKFEAAPYSPPAFKEVQEMLGSELLEMLIVSGRFVKVSAEVLFRRQEYQAMLDWVTGELQAGRELAAAVFRDHFNTSRKYALAFLEHLDAVGVTVRVGDYRKLKPIKNRP